LRSATNYRSDPWAGKEAGSSETYIARAELVLGIDGMPQIDEDQAAAGPRSPRFVHVDLSATTDPDRYRYRQI
jgi:hypothetical protein